MHDLVISGGVVVTGDGEWRADIAVQDGRIAALAARGGLGSARRIIDATGRHVLPGLVDAHVHLRDPGFTHKEDFRSGTMAAAAGGVTTVMACPNTKPPVTNPESLRLAVSAGLEKAVVDFAVLPGALMAEPAAITAFDGMGALAYDLLDNPYQHGTDRWIELFRRARVSGVPLAFYLNDDIYRAFNREELEARGVPPHECWVGAAPGTLEPLCMGRIIPLAERFRVPVVLRAVTTPQGLEFVRQMRRIYPDAPVAVEVCVHYLFLTMDHLATMGARAYMGPPVRPAAELAALWQAVRDRTVDFIATDHAPHSPEEKAQADIFRSPPGIVGLETFLPLMLAASAEGRLRRTDIVRLCCEGPARAFGLYPRKGAIAVGADADLVVVDVAERWRVDGGRFYTRGDPGPFDGWEMVGRPRLTLVRGETVMEDGVVVDTPRGRLLTRST